MLFGRAVIMKVIPSIFFMLIGTVLYIPVISWGAAGPDTRCNLFDRELYCSIHPDRREWSLVNGIAAYQSGFLSNFFKAHETIEILAHEACLPIEVVCESLANSCFADAINYDSRLTIAIDLEDPYQFFQHHFELLKHLFFVQEGERILKIAQGTKTFAHQVAQSKIDAHNFIEIMAQIVAYGIAYTHNVAQQEPAVRAMNAVETTLKRIKQSSQDQLEFLRHHELANIRLDGQKTAALDSIKKEFDPLITQATRPERAAFIAQKKQREQEVAGQIAHKKNELACDVHVHDALGLVRDLQKKLHSTVDENMQAQKQNVAGCVIREQDKKAIDQAIQNIHLLKIDEERARIIEALRTVVRGNLCAARTDIVSRFDKKSGEHVRHFMTVLESALGQELYGVPGLAAKMIMAFTHEQLGDKYDRSDLCIKLYGAIAKKDPLFINTQMSVECSEDQAVDSSLNDATPTDAVLIDSIICATKAGLYNLDCSYQPLVNQLLAYSKRSEIVHPYCTYNKSNFTIVAKKNGEKESSIKEKNEDGDGESTHQVVRFADCVECTLRNIIGELISNGDSFDCAALEILGTTPAVQNYFRNFSATYHDCQTFKARNKWANVVAGHKGVMYKQTEYACAVKATVKNFLNMLDCLFEPGRILQKPLDALTLNDIAALFTTLCNQMNDYFLGTKKIELIKIVASRNGDPLGFDVQLGDGDDEHMVLEFMVSKNGITQNIVVTVMQGHANFDVHKITGTVQSAAQNAIKQLHQFLYTEAQVNCQLRNELLDLMTELGFNRAIKQVQESLMMKGETCAPYNYEEQALSQARCLLYLMPDWRVVQRVVKYLADI